MLHTSPGRYFGVWHRCQKPISNASVGPDAGGGASICPETWKPRRCVWGRNLQRGAPASPGGRGKEAKRGQSSVTCAGRGSLTEVTGGGEGSRALQAQLQG